MSLTSSLTGKNYNSYLRDFYSYNRTASQKNGRTGISTKDLITADSSAMQKISKSLRDIQYTSDNGTELFYTVKSFVTAYNNLYTSAGSSSQYDINHCEKFIKNLTKAEKNALSEIGITVSSSGKLELDEDELSEVSPKKLSSIFSSDSDFTKKMKFYSNKIYKASKHVDTLV